MRMNQFFLSLTSGDQVALLEETWSELFLLSAAYWPIDVGVLVLRMYTSDGQHTSVVSISPNINVLVLIDVIFQTIITPCNHV